MLARQPLDAGGEAHPLTLVGPVAVAPAHQGEGVGTLMMQAALSRATGRPVPRILLVAPAPITEVGEIGEQFVGGAEKSRRLAPALRAASSSGAGWGLACGVVSPLTTAAARSARWRPR